MRSDDFLPTQQDLFDQNNDDWHTDPQLAFASWLKMHNFRANSATVYSAMWTKFLDWLAQKTLTLDRIEPQHIDLFLNENQLHKHHRYRYIRLIERVFEHISALQHQHRTNPASLAAQQRIGLGENDPTTFLSLAEIQQLQTYLRQPLEAHLTATQRFKCARDRALTALILATGLKVFQLRALTTDALQIHSADTAYIVLPPDDHQPVSRSVPVLPFALPVLTQWRDIRSAAVGNQFFISDRRGATMHAASIFRRIKKIFELAGIAHERSERASPQTLRNSFAAWHYAHGVDEHQVAQWLGLIEPTSARRLYVSYLQWRERGDPLPTNT